MQTSRILWKLRALSRLWSLNIPLTDYRIFYYETVFSSSISISWYIYWKYVMVFALKKVSFNHWCNGFRDSEKNMSNILETYNHEFTLSIPYFFYSINSPQTSSWVAAYGRRWWRRDWGRECFSTESPIRQHKPSIVPGRVARLVLITLGNVSIPL